MEYQFNHAWPEERKRLAYLEAASDSWSMRGLSEIGVLHGLTCLEVGGGGGSIAAWLCRKVGPTGQVVATDLETRFLESIDAPNLEVRRHDIRTNPLETKFYDLIHSRAVLDHLPARDAILKKLVASLKDGGWLAIEGGDFSTVRAITGSEEERNFFDQRFQSMIQVGEATGMDPVYGRRLGILFRIEGLSQVRLDGFVQEWDRTHPLALLYRMTFGRLRKPALESGKISNEELERLLELMDSPQFRAIGHTLYQCRGQKKA